MVAMLLALPTVGFHMIEGSVWASTGVTVLPPDQLLFSSVKLLAPAMSTNSL